MKEKLTNMEIKLTIMLWRLQSKACQAAERLITEEKGASDMVTIVVIIVIVIGVAGIFKDSLEDAIKAVFTKLTTFIG